MYGNVLFLLPTGFITGLLNNVGTHIDPTRLIKVQSVIYLSHKVI